MKLLKGILTIAALLGMTLPAVAVTDKEMDEARAITAKAYLRYVNNGSGYLDDISVKSMSELTSKLKEKEKENLKAFTAVKTPTDYASWSKEKLVEYWSSTFFQSPGLDAAGKGARPRVKKQISEMKVSAPSAAAETPAATEEAAAPEAAQEAAQEAPQDYQPDPAAAEQDVLADQKAIEEDAAQNPPSQQEENHTAIYVIVLLVLIGVVVWLVVYAANLMKKQPSEEKQAPRRRAEAADDTDSDTLRQQARAAIANKDREVEALRKRLDDEENRSAEIGTELERMKLENKRLLAQLDRLREENVSLSEKLSSIERAARLSEPARPAAREEERPRQRQTAAAPARKAEPEERKEEKEIIKVIYLGRANSRGFFVRADRRVSSGNTVYRLDTDDGLVGTFRVVDMPEVVDRVLSNPEEYLSGGCQGEELSDTFGVKHIVTESAGTAIFEDGYWKVLRKSKIRYE